MSDLVKLLRESYDKVSLFPENQHNGFMLLLELRNIVPEAADRIEQLEADLASAAKSDPMTATEILLGREIGRLEAELAAERALSDNLHEELIRSGMVMSQSILNYRKARGL